MGKSGLRWREMTPDAINMLSPDGCKYAVRLTADEAELCKVISESRKHPGWD